MVKVRHGIITIEWPAQCTYWKEHKAMQFVQYYN